MIEFAPNPTGPAHIGTLRTYLAAKKEAESRGLPLSVRFDEFDFIAPNGYGHRGPSDNQQNVRWAQSFLNETTLLEVPPDVWSVFNSKIVIDHINPDLEVVPVKSHVQFSEVACFKIAREMVNKDDPLQWRAGLPPPQFEIAELLPYAWHRWDGSWMLAELLTRMIYGRLRGVSLMVRSYLSQSLGFRERAYAENLKIPALDEMLTSVVVGDEGALSKSRLKVGDPGTVSWAIQQIGEQETLRRVRESLERTDEIIHYKEIIF